MADPLKTPYTSSSPTSYSNQTSPIIVNPLDNNSSLISINTTTQISIKLTSSNYTSWRFQFHAILIGYDLMGFIDGSNPCPSPTITTETDNKPNPDYSLWIRQDQLILSAIAGSISPNLVPFIASAKTSQEAWTILANTYAKPSRGRLTQLKEDLRLIHKGTQTITDYLQHAKTIADELAMLNAPIDNEDLILKILGGLDEDYKDLCSAIRVRDNPITFDELHEKLINFEAHLKYEARKKANLSNMPVPPIQFKNPFTIHLKTSPKIVPLIHLIVHLFFHIIVHPSFHTHTHLHLLHFLLLNLVPILVSVNFVVNKVTLQNVVQPLDTFLGLRILSLKPILLPHKPT